MTEEEVRRRLPVWVAFSDLFLDNETQGFEYRHIARVCGESGYTREELRKILFEEVGPAFASNLLQVAGEWAGWPEDVVLSVMQEQVKSPKGFPWLHRDFLNRHTAGEWASIEALLDVSLKGTADEY